MQESTKRTENKVCPKCFNGYLFSTGKVVMQSSPTLYLHDCTECDHTQVLEDIYPHEIMSVESRINKESEEFVEVYNAFKKTAKDALEKRPQMNKRDLFKYVIYDYYELWSAKSKDEIKDSVGHLFYRLVMLMELTQYRGYINYQFMVQKDMSWEDDLERLDLMDDLLHTYSSGNLKKLESVYYRVFSTMSRICLLNETTLIDSLNFVLDEFETNGQNS